MSLLIRNAQIVNASGEAKKAADIWVEEGKIVEIAPSIKRDGCQEVDARGKKVLPGLIDLHVHLREPGREDKETIETGSRAAAKGGFTTIFCMPNTTPAIDTAQTVQYILDQAKKVGLVNVSPVGAITKAREGKEITEMVDLKRAGCLGISDDGRGVMNAGLMRRALEYAKMAGLLVMQHCEDENLSAKGVMNEGAVSTLLGLKGDPIISETVMIARDIEIAKYLGTRIHFMHISSARSVDLIRRAKAEGVQVTCEATPHHFALTEEMVKGFDATTRVNPPLRHEKDVEAIRQGLRDGTIDAIATDHAPHTCEDKELEFDAAPPGVIGLETAFGLAVTELVNKGVVTLPQLAGLMSAGPARVMGLPSKGEIAPGKDADITIVDMDKIWTVSLEDTVSKSNNTPFVGRKLTGRVFATVCGGKVVYSE